MLRVHSLDEYLRYEGETAELKARKREIMAQLVASGGQAPRLDGYSAASNSMVHFRVDTRMVLGDGTYNLRETVNCPTTGFNMRMRAAIQAVRQCETDTTCRIYIAEQKTPLFRFFCEIYGDVSGSEYLGDSVPLGARDASGLRNEDGTQLTFPNNDFDVVLSFEVLEHIPDYKRALRETHRILRPGGRFYLTAPFIASRQETLVRAKVEDGEIVHILEPEYHGDPVRQEGILCFQHFGWDLADCLREAGFDDVAALVFDRIEEGYYTEEAIIVIRAQA